MMKEPTALAPAEKHFQVVAPIGYGSGGPYRLPSALLDISFFPQRDCTALPWYHCLLQKMYAMPPLSTTQSGKLPGTTPPHLMQCFVAAVRRRHPPKRFRNHVYCCLVGKISIMALQLLPLGGRGLRRSQSSGGPRCRTHPTFGQPRSHSQAAPTTPRPFSGTSGRTGPRVPCRDDPHTLLSDVLVVGKTPVISSAHGEVTTSTAPRAASRPLHTVHATTDTRNALHRRAHSAVA